MSTKTKTITVNVSDAPIKTNQDLIDIIADVSSDLEDLSDEISTNEEFDKEDALSVIDEVISELSAIRTHLDK